MRRRRRKVTLKRRLQCYAARAAVGLVLSVAAVVVWGSVSFILNRFETKDEVPEMAEKEVSAKAASTNKVIQKEKSKKQNVSSDMLILVNKQKPLPEDYEKELHLLKNGKNVAEVMYEDLRDMLFSAGDDLIFIVASGYRTRAEQEQLFSEEMEKNRLAGMDTEAAYTDAEQSVAPVGFSEHETGLCVDIVAESNQRMDETQEDTPENKWLQEHCAEYGFILRYPKGKEDVTGFMYESWHFRYVGKEAAKEITEAGITLEEYLSK